MATTTVPFGRVEVYARKGEMLPSNTWAVDAHGKYVNSLLLQMQRFVEVPINVRPQFSLKLIKLCRPCLDAHEVIHEGGGMLPLGGASEQTGGHKGYVRF